MKHISKLQISLSPCLVSKCNKPESSLASGGDTTVALQTYYQYHCDTST